MLRRKKKECREVVCVGGAGRRGWARKQAGAARKQASGFKWHQDLLDVGQVIQVKGKGGAVTGITCTVYTKVGSFPLDCVEKQE